MKFYPGIVTHADIASPSIRREWIEITCRVLLKNPQTSPSIRREWIEMQDVRNDETLCGCLPPYGGSGLKYRSNLRRCACFDVSLHTEGVD